MLTNYALHHAISQIGVKEVTRNSGPEVDKYLASVHLTPGKPWCAAFGYWCLRQAARGDNKLYAMGVPRTGSVHKFWEGMPERFRRQHPVKGALFFMDKGGGKGHMGFIIDFAGRNLVTVEGNTNAAGSREGKLVAIQCRDISAVNLGYAVLPEA